MILEQFLNKKVKEIDNPISNWGVGYTAEVINEWIHLQIQAKKLAIPTAEEEMKADAKLAAAAPDLLKALQALMDGVANLPPLTTIAGVLKTEWEQGLKAINKAIGL